MRLEDRRNPSSSVSWSKSHRGSGRALDHAAPFCPRRRDVGAHHRGIEHLDEVSSFAHGGERFEECFEDARLAQPPDPFPNAVPVAELGGKRPPSDVVDRENGYLIDQFLRVGTNKRAADVPEPVARFMAISQVPVSGDALKTKATVAAWKQKPSYAVIPMQDRMINPDLERFMTKRAQSQVIELPGSQIGRASCRK